MTKSRRAGEPTCKWAAIQVDALPADERAAYQQHLQDGCPVCGPDPLSFREAAQQLGFSVTPVSPPSSLRERLLQRIEETQAFAEVDSPTEETENGKSTVQNLKDWIGVWPGVKLNRLGWLSAAAVVLVACLGGWATLSVWNGSPGLRPANEKAYIDSLFAHVTAIIRVGLGDHIHCAVFRKFPKDPPPDGRIAEKMGAEYAGLLGLVKERVPDEYRLFLGHHCRYRGRKFLHLSLKNEAKLLSVIITRKQPGESFSQAKLLPVLNHAGVPIYREGVAEFEVAGFDSDEHLVFVISDLSRGDNLRLAASLAPAVHEFLSERRG